MTREQAAARVEKLRTVIDDYRYHYHVLDESTMSEAAADSLKHELSQLEAQFPDLITPDSPTQRVAGKPLGGFTSVAHSSRMLSLNDVFDADEMTAWSNRIAKLTNQKLRYFADIKMDGLACALIYENGLLVRAITRGDGFTGEDVTANVRTIESVPLRLRTITTGAFEVRGEIVMYKQDFADLNAQRTRENKPLFANPRNTAAGTIRQLDPELVAARPLHFRAYDVRQVSVDTHADAYELLHTEGFLVNKDAAVFDSVDEVLTYADTWQDARKQLPFETDGLVVKVNDRAVYEELGVVGKAPRGAVAYKYAAEQATTKVKDIFISIGRTGSATPVAMLEPVVVAGSTVQMATLHNEAEVARKDIRIGDTVIVHKAGDIIPEIVAAVTDLRDGSEQAFIMPKKCPDCASDLMKVKAADAAWRCPNQSCPSRMWRRIEHYASKGALDIEGLGEKNVIALIDAGLVQDIADIYAITAEQLLQLDRFASVSANKLVNAIADKKQPSLPKFLFGLGIRHVGTQTAIDIATQFTSLSTVMSATIEELSAIDGVGEVVAESVVEYFSEPNTQALLDKFASYGVQPQEMQAANGALSGKKFVVTGTLTTMSRTEAADKIRELGGTFQSSVGKDTDYLVVGENVGASKLAKADKMGTKRLSESEFVELLNSQA